MKYNSKNLEHGQIFYHKTNGCAYRILSIMSHKVLLEDLYGQLSHYCIVDGNVTYEKFNERFQDTPVTLYEVGDVVSHGQGCVPSESAVKILDISKDTHEYLISRIGDLDEADDWHHVLKYMKSLVIKLKLIKEPSAPKGVNMTEKIYTVLHTRKQVPKGELYTRIILNTDERKDAIMVYKILVSNGEIASLFNNQTKRVILSK